MPERLTDTLTYVLSVALAVGVIAFASYKVIRLNGMENPPANMGLNFPPAKRRMIVDQPVAEADPIITRTIAPVLTTAPRPSAPDGRSALSGPVRSYELLAVVDGVAFVEIDLARGKTLVPVTVGSVLPGGLLIESIIERNGRWVLVAGPLRLERPESPVQ
jgi:hypothetical protein